MDSMDAIDKAILEKLQQGLAVCNRPYLQMASDIGTSEQEVVSRINSMKEKGIIRRISAFYNSKKLGYTSALCATRVDEDKITDVSRLINRYSGVTHNYVREDEYNIWFTLIAENELALDRILSEIEQSPYVDTILKLSPKRVYKVKVNFKL